MLVSDPAIPFGSTVVVVGANGCMALEVIDKVLLTGYRVRGTVRDVTKHSNVRTILVRIEEIKLIMAETASNY